MERIGAMVIALGVLAAAATGAPAQTAQQPSRSTGSTLRPVEDAESLGRWRASQLIGTEVKDAAGQGVGKIEDIIVEPSGRIPMMVLSFGGFLGMGEKLFAVPWSAMRIERDDRDSPVVMLDQVRKETLANAPGFTRDRWPDPRDRRWGEESQRYWSDSSITAAIKTRLARERAGSLTDVDVDTDKGVVRLSGTVPNDSARRRAAELARAVEGVRDVRNDLRVQSGG
jgi:sporulation protein YlmC with PRC-barrel domain